MGVEVNSLDETEDEITLSFEFFTTLKMIQMRRY